MAFLLIVALPSAVRDRYSFERCDDWRSIVFLKSCFMRDLKLTVSFFGPPRPDLSRQEDDVRDQISDVDYSLLALRARGFW